MEKNDLEPYPNGQNIGQQEFGKPSTGIFSFKKKIKIILVLAGFVIVSGIIYFDLSNKGIKILGVTKSDSVISKNSNKSNLSTPKTSNLQEEKNIVYGKQKLEIPLANNSLTISKNDLPVELTKFIQNDNKNLVIKSTVSKNNMGGFNFSYDLENKTVQEVFSTQRNIASFNKWQSIGGSRSENFAFLDYKNLIFQLKIEFTQINNTQVHLNYSAIKVDKQ